MTKKNDTVRTLFGCLLAQISACLCIWIHLLGLWVFKNSSFKFGFWAYGINFTFLNIKFLLNAQGFFSICKSSRVTTFEIFRYLPKRNSQISFKQTEGALTHIRACFRKKRISHYNCFAAALFQERRKTKLSDSIIDRYLNFFMGEGRLTLGGKNVEWKSSSYIIITLQFIYKSFV